MRMDQIDANFRVNRPEEENYRYVSCRELTLEGFPWLGESDRLIRLPERIMDAVRPTLAEIAKTTAGGVVRFRTNSEKISVRCEYSVYRDSAGMPLASEAGVDLYRKDSDSLQFVGNFCPGVETKKICMEVNAHPDGVSEYLLYLPLYSGLEELWVGVAKDAILEPAEVRPAEDTVLFYGSSVTNGGCASRPGMTYPAIVTRELEKPMINLGFNGNARGDRLVAEEIAKLPLAMVVMEYDHNAPNPEFLKETHEPFYRMIRESHPDIPVIFLSRPFFERSRRAQTETMREVVLETVQRAKAAGECVGYVDGLNIFTGNPSDYSVDGIHPNDLGFRRMADAILQQAKELLVR